MDGGPGVENLTGNQKLVLQDIRAGRTLGEIAGTIGASLKRANDVVMTLRARFGLVEWVCGQGESALYRICSEEGDRPL